jgi:hypothetical protein
MSTRTGISFFTGIAKASYLVEQLDACNGFPGVS